MILLTHLVSPFVKSKFSTSYLHIFKVKTVSGLLELGFLSFIIAWYGLENIENGLYYFYPISLVVYLIHVGIMRFISHQLAKNAV